MKLSDVQTMDGVTLEEGGTYYVIDPITYSGIYTVDAPEISYNDPTGTPFATLRMNQAWPFDCAIVNGTAIGLWASRETLEAGLGKGKVN
jgi:hypothetical protein